MTKAYLGNWLDAANNYRMQLLGDAADNPDQRIAEDIQLFVERTLTIGIGLLSALVTLGSFVVILWTLSVAAPLHIFGTEWNIPGYLVWAALVYALVGTYFTHLIGWPLVTLNFNQQRYEADFRFNLVRVRENSEQIALLKGEPAETERLVDRFGRVVANWLLIMTRTKRLTFFTASYSQVSIVFPYVVVSPAYFSGKMQLGGLMQTASAFNSVQTSLSFFINVYRSLAEWRSVIQRLTGLAWPWWRRGRGGARTAGDRGPGRRRRALGRTQRRRGGTCRPAWRWFRPTTSSCRGASPCWSQRAIRLRKSTLFRAIAGIWQPLAPAGSWCPRDARLMMLPQRPYFPWARSLPRRDLSGGSRQLRSREVWEAINAVGLPALAQRLDEEALEPHALDRRAAASRHREALLQKPDFLFLDEATASLDEPPRRRSYRLIQERLPDAAVISIGHRSTLAAFHRRRLALERDGRRLSPARAVLKPDGHHQRVGQSPPLGPRTTLCQP
jgi:putative ATP-binding cassette transporter